MNNKEKILEWLIRPQGYYIRRYILLLREEEKLTNRDSILKFWYKARKNRLGAKLGFIIPAGCFGENLRIEHYGSIIVHPDARIGENCTLHGNCCIGNKGGINTGVPRIGNNVDIGQFSQVLGDVRIADDVVIGAGSVVVSDILEKGAVVAGVPAKIIKHKV